jgi:hypothetical protein
MEQIRRSFRSKYWKRISTHVEGAFLSASAVKGTGIFETLREISKLVVKDVSRKIMLLDKQVK